MKLNMEVKKVYVSQVENKNHQRTSVKYIDKNENGELVDSTGEFTIDHDETAIINNRDLLIGLINGKVFCYKAAKNNKIRYYHTYLNQKYNDQFNISLIFYYVISFFPFLLLFAFLKPIFTFDNFFNHSYRLSNLTFIKEYYLPITLLLTLFNVLIIVLLFQYFVPLIIILNLIIGSFFTFNDIQYRFETKKIYNYIKEKMESDMAIY